MPVVSARMKSIGPFELELAHEKAREFFIRKAAWVHRSHEERNVREFSIK